MGELFLVAMKPALLVIDMSRGPFSPNHRDGVLFRKKDRLIQCINDLVDFFKQRQLPIFWVVQHFHADLSDAPLIMKREQRFEMIDETDEWKILPELHYEEGKDALIIKKRYSAFFGTPLKKNLDQHRVDTLVIAGVNTHACVRMTSIDAYQYDFPVIWPSEGIASSLPEFERETLKYMVGGLVQRMDNEQIQRFIQAPSK